MEGETGQTFPESEQQRQQKCYAAHALSFLQNREIGWNSKPCLYLSLATWESRTSSHASHLLLLPSGLIIDGCCSSQRANDHAADRPCHLHAVIELRAACLPYPSASAPGAQTTQVHNPFTGRKMIVRRNRSFGIALMTDSP